mmetsp:Transcript_30796/g.46715  ORF Transcript_30796/g.46715 Transcript_30796/m.46715 type:complete len:158 (+) Transcript_30796:457-930(+)|eukprot:CAMPEP_0178921250 /NCGR_PEP_ID=MMETSP0786-20121207/15458_1 /TAXON_ID=186022 /ORGANISM="Thalassionema frauenfeldii, Strain CCMP 1798" /LENGTH=157 /DNA_ID=CAMNT_0020595411 /DNA_START=348 /DNA_END=821 /DNA_ORIENTATION=+
MTILAKWKRENCKLIADATISDAVGQKQGMIKKSQKTRKTKSKVVKRVRDNLTRKSLSKGSNNNNQLNDINANSLVINQYVKQQQHEQDVLLAASILQRQQEARRAHFQESKYKKALIIADLMQRHTATESRRLSFDPLSAWENIPWDTRIENTPFE